MIGNISTDVVESAIATFVPGADSILPDLPWYRTWWGVGLIGIGGLITLSYVLRAMSHPRYIVAGEHDDRARHRAARALRQR